MPTMPSFRLLGLFEATSAGGQQLNFPTTKAQAMLAYLLVEDALHPGISHQRGKLMTLLWPDITQESAQTNLRQTLYRLRKTLSSVEVEAEQLGQLLISDRLSVQLNPAVAYWLDVAEFERALQEAGEGAEEQRRENLTEVAALYRGHFLADVSVPDSEPFESWATQVREELRRKTLETLQQITALALAREDWAQAQEAARRQIALDDLNEAAYRQLMLAQASAGQRNEALAEFAALRQLLAGELGLEPTNDTMRLVAAIRAGEYERESRPVRRQAAQIEPNAAGRQAEIILLDKVDRFWVKGVLQQSLPGERPFALRMATAPDALASPWEMVVGEQATPERPLPAGISINQIFSDSGQALLILGEAGAGKTTTMLELAAFKIEEARANPAAVLPVVFTLRSWADKRLPITEWLVEELNAKYLIPIRIGRPWIEAGRLLLLLDGLDEVRAEGQAACVTAINAFRQEYGLVPIVVSSRVGDYETSPKKLQLGEAIRLLPLDSEQAAFYLQELAGPQAGLASILERDPRLANLAQSPLMLNIMALTFGDEKDALSSLETTENGRQQLLDTYVAYMFRWRGKRGPISAAQTTDYLGWLARSLIERDQTVFLLEQLQPSWLKFARSRWIYALATRTILSILLAIVFLAGAAELSLEEFGLSVVVASLLTYLFIGAILGGAVALRFKRQLARRPATRQEDAGRHKALLVVARVVVVGLLAFLVTIAIFRAFGFDGNHTASVAYFNALLFALIFGVRGRRRSVGSDIRPVETVIWSWKRALTGCIPGLLVGSALGILDQYVTSNVRQNPVILLFGILGALVTGLVGGLRRGAVAGQDRPNSGLVLSLRYGLRVGLVFGLVIAVAFAMIFSLQPDAAEYRWIALQFALRIGFSLGLIALLWYGGIEILNHIVLRALLRSESSIPPRYADFLDYVVDLIFLRRVGGGYIFVHQLLHDYFAQRGKSSPSTDEYGDYDELK